MSSQIKKGATISYASIFINFALGLIYTPWMVRMIGVSDYGIYALVGAFISYFVMDFGLGQTVARFVSVAVANGDKEKEHNILSTTLRIYLFLDIIIFLCLVISYMFLNDIFGKLTPEEISRFKVVFCISGFCSIISFPMMPLSGIMIAHERFVPLKMCDLLHKILIAIITISLLFAGFGLYALVIGNAAVGIGIAYYKLYYVRFNLGIKYTIKQFDYGLAKSLFNFSLWVMVVLICQRLLVNICPTILGIKASTTQISIFAIGSTLEAYVWIFSQALNGLFMPRVASLSLKGSGKKEISELMIRIGRLQLFITGLIITGFFVLGRQFIVLWMGPEFYNSYWVAIMMFGLGIITLTESIAETLLYIENEVKYRAVIFSFTTIISFSISWFMSEKWGAIGCGIGILFSNLFCHVICMNFVYKYKLKLEIGRFFKECHLNMAFPLLFTMGLGFLATHFINVDNWGIFAVTAATYGIVYFIFFWLISLNVSEKNLIRLIINKAISK